MYSNDLQLTETKNSNNSTELFLLVNEYKQTSELHHQAIHSSPQLNGSNFHLAK